MASAYGNMTRYTYSLNEDRETRAGCENSIESDESELFCSLRLETHSASKSYAKYLDFGRLLDEGIGTPTSADGQRTAKKLKPSGRPSLALKKKSKAHKR